MRIFEAIKLWSEGKPADISKKIKSVKVMQAHQGKRIGGYPPFGYMVDPSDKHKNIINPDTAPIVQRMFEMAADGKEYRHAFEHQKLFLCSV